MFLERATIISTVDNLIAHLQSDNVIASLRKLNLPKVRRLLRLGEVDKYH